jgi:hypothetical protein
MYTVEAEGLCFCERSRHRKIYPGMCEPGFLCA